MATCLWCARSFTDGTRGERKRFCGADCRQAFHTAARRWAESAVAAGVLSVAEIKRAAECPPNSMHGSLARNSPSPLPDSTPADPRILGRPAGRA